MKNGVCEKEGVAPEIPVPGSKLGVALSTLGQEPINGLRHLPEKGTNGWYIWCGNSFSEADDFFEPLHIEHIDDYLPMVKATDFKLIAMNMKTFGLTPSWLPHNKKMQSDAAKVAPLI
jgi:hypothetical protein